eukprot:CAMPEP_0203945804 /NCGR_PEP_ID=MMETSP0359-20131031/81245_1 /ASSEMBLY_ACC=CAM_ASM_000338 /TAXON_ID=268821 /ORGANISM="Scrippsiella Hangoei, Strain SHTV-5" /LENGTH=763 /DNA_ID=CAMNT_0050877019 /DNA_START=28 /DNA_END=2319 /DNA_ORIENTATION=+
MALRAAGSLVRRQPFFPTVARHAFCAHSAHFRAAAPQWGRLVCASGIACGGLGLNSWLASGSSSRCPSPRALLCENLDSDEHSARTADDALGAPLACSADADGIGCAEGRGQSEDCERARELEEGAALACGGGSGGSSAAGPQLRDDDPGEDQHEGGACKEHQEHVLVAVDLGHGKLSSLGLVRRVFGVLGWHCSLLVAAGLVSLLKVGTSLMNSANFGAVMNALGDPDALRSALIRMVGIQLCSSCLGLLQDMLLDAGLDVLSDRLQLEVFESLLQQDALFFDSHLPSELVTQVTADVDKVRSFMRTLTTDTVETFAGIFGNVIELVRVSPEVCRRIVLATVPGFTIFGMLLSLINGANSDQDAANVKLSSSATESLANIRTVQSFVAEEQELKKYSARRSILKAARRRLRALKRTLGATAGLWFHGVSAVILATSSRLVGEGKLSGGTVNTLFLHLFSLTASCGKLLGLLQTMAVGVGATRSVVSTLDARPSVGCTSLGAESSDEVCPQETSPSPAALEFDCVHFRYPNRSEEEVLKGVSLSLTLGSVVALVGQSGSGKSTIGWLAQRFYDCERGTVRVDGRDVRALDPRQLRRQIAYVEQEPALFSGTIRDNIRYGRPCATDAEVAQAAEAALVDDFAKSLPRGLDTEVGDAGTSLSGGQKQRVAIARALLKDPRLLILDEATSALDSASERRVQEAMRRLMQGRTTLIIAHRLSTVRSADRIVVLEQGEVREVGTHAELLSRSGLYAKFVRQQDGEGPS